MSDKETYHEGICRLLRGMTGKMEMSFGRSTILSEWTLSVYIADAPAWFRGDNWMLPHHAANEIERLHTELVSTANKLHAERDEARRERDEARREVCEKEAWLRRENGSARDHAERMGWDCFKENTNGS